MAKIYGQLEKAQLENTTADAANPPAGLVSYRTDTNVAKVGNGTSWLTFVDTSTAQTLTNKTLTSPTLTTPTISSFISNGVTFTNPTADGTNGQVLKTNGSGVLSFVTALTDPMTTRGDIIVRDSSNLTERLGVGAARTYLMSNGTDPSYQTFVPPTVQVFTSGSGTYNRSYVFTISSGSATVGATYTNNGVTYTVSATVSSATRVVMTGNNVPTETGTLTKASGTGDATLIFSHVAIPIAIKVRAVGGGGQGGGGGPTNGGGQTAGGNGGNTTFGSSLITANGGTGGAAGNTGGSQPTGGAGGSTTALGTGAFGYTIAGASGHYGWNNLGGVTGIYTPGGAGGSSFFGGAGNSIFASTGQAAATNSGSGGQGGGVPAVGVSGAGGGAGAFVEAYIPSPAVTYSYAVGAAGSGAGAGNGSGTNGGNGGAGLIIVEEIYQ